LAIAVRTHCLTSSCGCNGTAVFTVCGIIPLPYPKAVM
jgi:hypothetical protein